MIQLESLKKRQQDNFPVVQFVLLLLLLIAFLITLYN